MPQLSIVEARRWRNSQGIYDFLPGTFASVTWPDVAARFCLERYWLGGSKLPAITNFLRNTVESHRDTFCDFIVAVVREGIAYRLKKNPLKREEIDECNWTILKLQFKIPELHDRVFLDGLPSSRDAGEVRGLVRAGVCRTRR